MGLDDVTLHATASPEAVRQVGVSRNDACCVPRLRTAKFFELAVPPAASTVAPLGSTSTPGRSMPRSAYESLHSGSAPWSQIRADRRFIPVSGRVMVPTALAWYGRRLV